MKVPNQFNVFLYFLECAIRITLTSGIIGNKISSLIIYKTDTPYSDSSRKSGI